MFLRIDTRYFLPRAPLVRKIGMAADTERATAINVQPYRIFRMIILGAVTVFTTDGSMGRVLDIITFVLMTFPAGRGGLVLHRILFPDILIRFAVPAIHVTPLMHTEVIRD